MAQSILMKKGLEGIFSPEKKFEAEARYGQNIYWVAWAVEILAALIGLTIALATAYDAFRGIPDPNTGHYINAIIGALPFLVIAVIEPTKIPLAGGFYKTRIMGYKILILIVLIGLTIVTFETMFNGLERNLTNVTRDVVEAENKIQFLSDKRTEKERELEGLNAKSTTELVSGIQAEIDKLQSQYITDIENTQNQFAEQINQLRTSKSNIEDQIAASAGIASSSTKTQVEAIDKSIEALQRQISEQEDAKQNAIENYRKEVLLNQQQNESLSGQRIETLNVQISGKTEEIKALNDNDVTQTELFRKRISDENRDHKSKLAEINSQLQRKLDANKFIGRGKAREKANDEADIAIRKQERNHQSNLQKIERSEEQRKDKFEKEREALGQQLVTLQNRLSKVLDDTSKGVSLVDKTEIDSIKQQYDNRILPLQNQIAQFQKDKSQVISEQSGTSSRERQQLNLKIEGIDRRIANLNLDLNKQVEEKGKIFEKRRAQLEDQKANRVNQIEELKNNDAILELEIADINRDIDEAKKIKREASYDSQVYRLAALAYGKTDVADVTRDEIKVVSVVWFGSISLIVSTIGTVLALISYILRDPEAFVERPKVRFSKRIYVLLRLFFRQSMKLIGAIIKAIVAFSRLVLSFAEIFRGLIGIPLQKSIRRLSLAIRKRLNRPRVIEIEKEVEKIVEKEVEKIVEVEKPIEKIVEVEKVVEKVVTTEVPVEIVRKELVYVPLYSTDSGLIDASTELRGAKPKLEDDASRNNKEQNNDSGNGRKKK